MSLIFITGGTGYLGTVLVRQALAAGHTVFASCFSQTPPATAGVTWAVLDVRDPQAVAAQFNQHRPDLIIHTAYLQTGPDVLPITAEGAGHVAAPLLPLGHGLFICRAMSFLTGNVRARIRRPIRLRRSRFMGKPKPAPRRSSPPRTPQRLSFAPR